MSQGTKSQNSEANAAADADAPGEAAAGSSTGHPAPLKIKKYANRRLYNTETSGYETLESLAKMVREGVDFVVIDAKTGEDLTRSVLTQIILEAESRGEPLMPMRFMRDLIRCYGENVQSLVPGYLEMSMDMLRQNHQSMCRALETVAAPFRRAEEAMRRNSQFFAQSLVDLVPGVVAGVVKPSADSADKPEHKADHQKTDKDA